MLPEKTYPLAEKRLQEIDEELKQLRKRERELLSEKTNLKLEMEQ